MKDAVYDICERMLRHSPERSYKRLNPALRSTLSNCIEADLPFHANTFQRIYDDLRGGWWFGDGVGSHIGEHFYTLACQVNHSSAQQSFEAFAERPACLWEEDAKTPFRLHVGSEFTWKGHRVTVTSMRRDDLVACSYIPGGSRVVDRRFTISYAEIATLRRTAKARVKAIINQIPTCADVEKLNALRQAVNVEHFRHFELEEINAAFTKQAKVFPSADKVEAWRTGATGAWLGTDEILLRVNGARVECSNGNSIKKATATAILPILLKHRKKTAALNLPLEGFQVGRVSPSGVQVGCTLVPWPEIDRIADTLGV